MNRQNKLDDGLNRLFSSPKQNNTEDQAEEPTPAEPKKKPPKAEKAKSEKPEPKAPPKSHLIPVPSKPTLPLQMPFSESEEINERELSNTAEENNPAAAIEAKADHSAASDEKVTVKENNTTGGVAIPETKSEKPSTNKSASNPATLSSSDNATAPKSIKTEEESDVNTSSNEDEQIVVFTLDKQFYGVNISVVESIIKMQLITVVPRAPQYIEGVTNLRGTVVPVVSLHKRLNIPVVEESSNSRIIVINSHGISAGLIVDEVNSVTYIAGKNIEKVSQSITSVDSSYIRSIAKMEGKLIILLDLENVLKERT